MYLENMLTHACFDFRIRDMYKHIDAKYIKPCLLRENKFKDPKIIETFETLTNRDALEFVKRNPTQFSGLGGSKTMAELAVMGSSSANIMNKSPSTMMTRLVRAEVLGLFPSLIHVVGATGRFYK